MPRALAEEIAWDFWNNTEDLGEVMLSGENMSYLMERGHGEMSQNSERYSWTAEEVDSKLHQIMTGIHDGSAAAAEKYGLGYNLVAGANIVGFQKVADAMMAQGICW